MAVLLNVGSQSYSAQSQTLGFTVAANATQITVTLTHPDWPEGECIRAELLWGGVSSGIFSTGGGLIRNKAGVPIGGTTVLTRTASKPPGLTSGQVRLQTVQALTSAILVESF